MTPTGWFGPDDPDKADSSWGKEMLQAVADYLVDFLEEFQKAKIR